MNRLYFVAAIPLAVCVIPLVISLLSKWEDTIVRNSANGLVVLSGMLAALAILVPLGATLLPEPRSLGWAGWFLIGALLMGVVCVCGTIYCMLTLQVGDTFKPKEKRYVPCWNNVTWAALVLLACGVVAVKTFPASGSAIAEPTGATTPARFAIARDLPELGASLQVIETRWGIPALEKNSELLYRTKDGAIIFCLDSKGVTQSITETREANVNAIRPYCKED